MHLFAADDKKHDHHLVEAIAGLAYEALAAISNDFQGYEDDFWHFALRWMENTFPMWGDEPRGMDPLQQRVAMKVLKRVKENMKGYYPAISRVLIAVMDPYGSHPSAQNGSAYHLLEEILFLEWRGFQLLAQEHP